MTGEEQRQAETGDRPVTWPAPWRSQDVVVVLLTLAALLAVQLVLMLSARSPERYRGIDGLMFAVFPTTITAVVVAMRARLRGLSARELGLVRPRSWRPAFFAWFVASAAGPLTAYGQHVLAAVPEASFGLAANVMALVLVLSMLVPMAEEMIFRGLLYRSIRTRWHRFPAALLSGVIFSAAHLDAQTLLPLFIVGFVLAWAYEQSRSLWASVVAHGGLNALTVLVLVSRLS